ncbi:MAG: hypothetical protein ACR2GO_06080 [Candidatus Limnocylindria bacterium]
MAALVLALGGCGSSRDYSLACEDVLPDGSQAEVDCDALVEAVAAGLVDGWEVTEAAVWAFVGCPPGAYCALIGSVPSSPAPVSALIGVRTADGDASVWGVSDVAAHSVVHTITLGYDPNDFIDGLARSAAASRSP